MSSSNRRQGKSTRRTHLREARAPVDNGPTLTLAPEDTQVTCAQHVTVELTPEEYMELAGGGEATPTDAPTTLLARHRASDDADQHDEPSDPQRDEPASRSAGSGAAHDPPASTPSEQQPIEEDHDVDLDPHFEKFATATAAPTRSSGPPGSAAIDTAPVRSPRQRTSRLPAGAQDHRAGRRLRAGWVMLAAAVVAVVVLAIILQGTSRTAARRPAQASAPAHHSGALTTASQLTAAINENIAQIAKTAAPHTARRSARRSPTPHVKHRPSRWHRVRTPMQRAVRPAGQTSQHVQNAPAQGGASSSTGTNAPVSAPPAATTSKSSPPASTGAGPPKPPLYGQGGLLGAGHAG